jgi:hypothetical protein
MVSVSFKVNELLIDQKPKVGLPLKFEKGNSIKLEPAYWPNKTFA